jgi:hypothetical protein
MRDDEIERLLSQHRPSPPAPSLRARILLAAGGRRAPDGWATRLVAGPAFWAAAAAALGLTVVFTVAANRATDRASAVLAFAPTTDYSVADEAARLIGQPPSPEIRQALIGLPEPAAPEGTPADLPAFPSEPGGGR